MSKFKAGDEVVRVLRKGELPVIIYVIDRVLEDTIELHVKGKRYSHNYECSPDNIRLAELEDYV